jgi:histidyl-tRNA synthetase
LLRALEDTPATVLVTTMDARYFEKYLKIASQLRSARINTEVYLEQAKLDKQLQYANRKEFRIALIAGETEISAGQIQVKNLMTRQAITVPEADVVKAVQQALGKKEG